MRSLAPLHPRNRALVASGVVTVVLVSLLTMVPVPYALMSPGPVENVLSGSGSSSLISISGHETYPTSGRLDLLTVSVRGGPGQAANVFELLGAWADGDVDARPIREVYAPDVSRKDVEAENTAEMASSQDQATAAALSELGIGYTTTLSVGGFSSDAPATAVLRKDDEIVAVNGTTVTDLPQLRELMAAQAPGDEVQLTVRRDGQQTVLPVTTTSADDGKGGRRAVLGVIPRTTHDFPFDVKIKIEDVGGPSAGMMFALGILDKLTPGEMTGGRTIAGTGTVTDSGAVGAIGGIRQKLVGARDADATWFLAPQGNCFEVLGHVPAGMRVVRVATLHEARQAVETIGSGTDAERDALPTCTAG